MHNPSPQLKASDINDRVDVIVDEIAARIRSGEDKPVRDSKAQKHYSEIQEELPQSVAEIVKESFNVIDLSEVAWTLNTSLDKVFSALRFFERKMLKDQNKPIAREIKSNHWKTLSESQREALNFEFAGFHRKATAAHQGITNRTLTNKLKDIRDKVGTNRETFDAIKLRNASRNLSDKAVYKDRLINFVFSKEELDIDDDKDQSKNWLFKVSSLNQEKIVENIQGLLDRLPDKFKNAVQDYLNDEEIHTNALRNRGMTRTLNFAKAHLRRYMKVLVCEEAPKGLDNSVWAMYKNSKIRNALKLYLDGYSRAQIEKTMKKKISVESLWYWRQQFMKDFSMTQESLEKLRLRNKLSLAKSNKSAYRKRAFEEVFPQDTQKPKRKSKESKEDYYKRVLEMIAQVSNLYPKKETFTYFKYRILGLTTPQIAKIFDLSKSSIGTSLKNFTESIREKIYELEKLKAPKGVDKLNWLAIKEEHRPIVEAYLEMKAESKKNIFEKLEILFNDYTTLQLYAITHAARKKLGMKIL